MRPGPAFDAEIVKTIWRHLVVIESETGAYQMIGEDGQEAIPPFSTDINAVQQITDFYRASGWKLRKRRDGDGHAAAFVKNDGVTYRYFVAESIPEAICHAALAVVNGVHVQSK
jgi:hypothetical protein